MLPLWALAVVLAVQAEALDLQLPALGNLPVALPSGPVANSVPPVVPREPLRRSLSVPKGSPPGNVAVATKGRTCSPVARYFISAGKLEDYLGTTLPPQIEKLLKSEKVNLAGLLGMLLSTVGNSGLLSLLNTTSTLDILGSGSLVGILSQGSSGKSRQLPLLSEATGAVSDVLPLGQEGLGSLLPISPDKNSLKRLLDGAGLSGVQQPLNDVVNNVGQLRDSTQDVLSGALQSDIGKSLTGLLGNINVEELLLGLEVQKVTVENMKSTVASNGIHVHVTTTAFVGGKGLAGPVISLVGFEVHGDMALKIGTSTDSTHCVKLQVLEKAIKANKVTLQITKTLTGALPLPLPVPLPLDDIIPQLLTVKMSENVSPGEGEATGLFTYTSRSSRMSAEGLSTLYCVSAKARFNKNTVPVRGSQLPPDVKNANASLTLSHSMLRTIVTYAAKQSSLKVSITHRNCCPLSFLLPSKSQH
uniref:Uncharacterized protein n=1 Tax=Prolemur simus TaxID=1328070 RepID=A0A8C9DG60_PROSS